MKCDVEIKDFNIKNCYSVQCVPRELGTHNDMTAPLKRQKQRGCSLFLPYRIWCAVYCYSSSSLKASEKPSKKSGTSSKMFSICSALSFNPCLAASP